MEVITDFNILSDKLRNRISNHSDNFELYYYQPKDGESIYLDGDSFFSFSTTKPDKPQAHHFFPNKGEYSEYKFFNNSGIVILLFPDKIIKYASEIEEEVMGYCREKFGNNLEITFGDYYREADGYYRTDYYFDNNKFTVIDSPFDGVGILFYYGPNSLFLPTQEILTSLGEIIQKSLTVNEGVSFNL